MPVIYYCVSASASAAVFSLYASEVGESCRALLKESDKETRQEFPFVDLLFAEQNKGSQQQLCN